MRKGEKKIREMERRKWEKWRAEYERNGEKKREKERRRWEKWREEDVRNGEKKNQIAEEYSYNKLKFKKIVK